MRINGSRGWGEVLRSVNEIERVCKESLNEYGGQLSLIHIWRGEYTKTKH